MSRSLATRTAEMVGFEGDLVRLKVWSRPVWVTVRLDPEEHERRSSKQIGAVTNRSVLNALWELPHWEDVPLLTVPTWVRTRIADLGDHIVERTRTGVVRKIQYPVDVTGAISLSKGLRAGMKAVGSLSAIAPMAVATECTLIKEGTDYLDALVFGMGVVRVEGDDLRLEARPEESQPLFGSFRWWVSECAYSELLRHVTGVPPTD